jgi:hypothetical protein
VSAGLGRPFSQGNLPTVISKLPGLGSQMFCFIGETFFKAGDLFKSSFNASDLFEVVATGGHYSYSDRTDHLIPIAGTAPEVFCFQHESLIRPYANSRLDGPGWRHSHKT